MIPRALTAVHERTFGTSFRTLAGVWEQAFRAIPRMANMTGHLVARLVGRQQLERCRCFAGAEQKQQHVHGDSDITRSLLVKGMGSAGGRAIGRGDCCTWWGFAFCLVDGTHFVFVEISSSERFVTDVCTGLL